MTAAVGARHTRGQAATRVLEAVGVESRHVIDHHRVERAGGVGVVIVRQIGAGDERRAGCQAPTRAPRRALAVTAV
jgi:hypothetical protein